jgi:hypothetical protein
VGSEDITPTLFTSALDGYEWSASSPDCFIPGEISPCIQWMGDWVGPRAGLDPMVKRKILYLSGTEPWTSNEYSTVILTGLSLLKQLNMPLAKYPTLIWYIGAFHRKQQL